MDLNVSGIKPDPEAELDKATQPPRPRTRSSTRHTSSIGAAGRGRGAGVAEIGNAASGRGGGTGGGGWIPLNPSLRVTAINPLSQPEIAANVAQAVADAVGNEQRGKIRRITVQIDFE